MRRCPPPAPVSFDDDHRDETSLPGLDATVHAYVVIPCDFERSSANPDGIAKGTAARVRNLRTGACVDGLVGDCGGHEQDGCKVDGFGEMSYAAVRALGLYAGPERVLDDPIEVTIGVAPDPAGCTGRPQAPPPAPPPAGSGH
eukprot:SAG22_NODE_834_length_6927_cov_7.202402_3_plen_143_part_00